MARKFNVVLPTRYKPPNHIGLLETPLQQTDAKFKKKEQTNGNEAVWEEILCYLQPITHQIVISKQRTLR